MKFKTIKVHYFKTHVYEANLLVWKRSLILQFNLPLSFAFLAPGVLPRFFLTRGVTLLALLPAGVALLLILLFLGVLITFLTELLPDGLDSGELALESGELTRLLGVAERSLVLVVLFLEVRGVRSSSISSSLGGRLFFLVLLVDMLTTDQILF